MKNPVTMAVYAARSVVTLQHVIWHAKHVHWKHVASNTQCQWQNAVHSCAQYFMDTVPADAFWVYNTVFTFLRPEQCDELLARAKRRYQHTHQCKLNQNSMGSSSSSTVSSKPMDLRTFLDC